MNLAFVALDMSPLYGSGVYYDAVTRRLAAMGHRVWFLGAAAKEGEDYARDGVHYVHVPAQKSSIPFTSFLRWQWRVRRVLRRLEADGGLDVVEFSSYQAEGLIYTYAPRRARVCFRLHEWKLPLTFSLLQRDSRRVFRDGLCWLEMTRADALLPVSDAIRTAYLRFLGSDRYARKMHRHWVGVDMCQFAPTPARPEAYRTLDDKRILLFVGRITEAKGTYNLIEVYRNHLAPQFPDTVLVLIGEPENPARFQEVVSNRTDDNILYLGPLARDLLPSFYSHAYVFVLPSRNEGCSRVLIEALACGVPVVSNAIGGIPEIVEADRTGLLCSDLSQHTLATTLSRVLADRDLRDRLARMTRASVAYRFNWDTIAAELCETYREIAATRR
jgi:glycosyltransferase involved in cell wall biosynthesis